MKCDKTKQSVIIDLRRAETRSDLPRWNPANRSVLYPSLTRPFSDDDDGDDDDDAFLEISHKPKNMETDRNEKTPDQEERVWSSETHTRAHTHTHTHTDPRNDRAPKNPLCVKKTLWFRATFCHKVKRTRRCPVARSRTKSLQVSLWLQQSQPRHALANGGRMWIK